MNKNIKYYFIITAILFALQIILFYTYLQLKGQFTTRIIYWIWIFMTLFVIIKFRKVLAIKLYALVLFILIGLSILPMAIPFFIILNALTGIDTQQYLELNKEYRIEVRKGVLYKKKVYIYDKKPKLIILENLESSAKMNYDEILEKTLNIPSDSTYNFETTPIENVKFISANKDSIGIEYQILSKKKIIYHHLK